MNKNRKFISTLEPPMKKHRKFIFTVEPVMSKEIKFISTLEPPCTNTGSSCPVLSPHEQTE